MATATSNHNIQQLIHDQINLPSPPAIVVQILNTIQDEESSLEDLERVIAADPALTGKLLRIANSAFYSLPYEVSNVTRAMSILGTNVIKNIALSFVIAGNHRGEEGTTFDFDYFWRRSVTAGVAAELVMDLLHEINEDIFVTALLQDIGILIMFMSKGEEYAALLKQSILLGGTDLIDSEKEKYQFDHQLLGNTLLKDWGIPNSIINPIRFHHQPELAREQDHRATCVLNVANQLSAIYGGIETARNVHTLQAKMKDYFNVTEEQTRKLLDSVAEKSLEVLKIFEIDPGQMRPYSQMLQEANDELGKLNLSYEQLVLELKESKNKSERFADELRKANNRLEELAFRDGLTDIYNHRYFQEVLGKEMARSKRYGNSLCLIMFDIDFFKKVNDSYGHPAGDQVLIQLARTISQAIRPSDIIARYGGEEFAVILPETSEAGLRVFAERLRRSAASLTTVFKDNSINITISCGGVYLPPDNDVRQQDVINAADRGLFLSKENGRNRVTIVPIEATAN